MLYKCASSHHAKENEIKLCTGSFRTPKGRLIESTSWLRDARFGKNLALYSLVEVSTRRRYVFVKRDLGKE